MRGPSRLQRWLTLFPARSAPDAFPGSGYPLPPGGRGSLYRLCAGTTGISPPDVLAETDFARPWRTRDVQTDFGLGLLAVSTTSRRCLHPESVATSTQPVSRRAALRLEPLMPLAPSGFCTGLASDTVTGTCRSCPWAVRENRPDDGLPSSNLRLRATWASADCSASKVCRILACAGIWPLPSWDKALQGFLP